MTKHQLSLKARALRYLSSREYSRLELARKLTPYAQDDDETENLLNWLQESGFLSQARFSESLIHRRAGRYGNNRIMSELQIHGIDGTTLHRARQELLISEAARARDVLRRKFPTAPLEPETRAKCIRFLQQRGFSQDAVRTAMKSAWHEDDNDRTWC